MTPTTSSTSIKTSSRRRSAADVLKLVLEAVNRRDSEALVDLLCPDVEFFPILAALEGPVYSGLPGVRRWLRSLDLDWEVFETRLDRVYDLGDSVLGLGAWHVRGRTSGVELDSQPGAWHARVRDGRVAWWRTYTDRAEAMRSVCDVRDQPAARSRCMRSISMP
jgi:ketosteroid isomerase-like protein